MERPNYIPIDKEVRNQLKEMKGVKTYSKFLSNLIEFYNIQSAQNPTNDK